jgi:hypothetical protein
MRTVIVHLRNATEEQVEQFLSNTYPAQEGPPWVCFVEGDACLYIDVYRHLAIEFEPERVAALHSALGCAPSVSVSADVSGRHAGDEQVGDFVFKLLSAFEGLAGDEYTEGFWTLDDIKSDRRKPSTLKGRPDGHTFFDHSYPWHLWSPLDR